MKNIFNKIAVLLVVLSFTNLYAQTSSLDYTLTSNSIVTSGEKVNIVSSIKKTGSTLIWTQSNNGKIRSKNFIINSQSENWEPNSSMGNISYGISIEGIQGTLTLSGTSSGMRATLILNIPETETETIIFDIESITYL